MFKSWDSDNRPAKPISAITSNGNKQSIKSKTQENEFDSAELIDTVFSIQDKIEDMEHNYLNQNHLINEILDTVKNINKLVKTSNDFNNNDTFETLHAPHLETFDIPSSQSHALSNAISKELILPPISNYYF